LWQDRPGQDICLVGFGIAPEGRRKMLGQAKICPSARQIGTGFMTCPDVPDFAPEEDGKRSRHAGAVEDARAGDVNKTTRTNWCMICLDVP